MLQMKENCINVENLKKNCLDVVIVDDVIKSRSESFCAKPRD
jgi:hypothetical protein